MAEVGMAGREDERGRFEVECDAFEAILGDDAGDGRDEVGNVPRVVELEVLAASAEGDHYLLPLALECGDVCLQLIGIDAAGKAEVKRSFGRGFVGRGEGDEDDVPLCRDLVHRKRRIDAANPRAGPVTDELMPIGCRGGWRGCGGRLSAAG